MLTFSWRRIAGITAVLPVAAFARQEVRALDASRADITTHDKQKDKSYANRFSILLEYRVGFSKVDHAASFVAPMYVERLPKMIGPRFLR